MNYVDTARVFDPNHWLHRAVNEEAILEVDVEIESDPDNEFEEVGLGQRCEDMPASLVHAEVYRPDENTEE